MKLPSKVISYKESSLYKFPFVLGALQNVDMPVKTLYIETKKHWESVEDFIDVLDCLFALQRIAYDSEREVLYYVD